MQLTVKRAARKVEFISVTPPVAERAPFEGAIVTVPPLPAISEPKARDSLLSMAMPAASAGVAAATIRKIASNTLNGVAIRHLLNSLANPSPLYFSQTAHS